jgi:hypothetical protein
VPISPRPHTGLVAGTHRLHPDPSINFQLNRWVAWTGGRALADIRRIAPHLTDYEIDACSWAWPTLRTARAPFSGPHFTCGRPSSSFAVTILTSCR